MRLEIRRAKGRKRRPELDKKAGTSPSEMSYLIGSDIFGFLLSRFEDLERAHQGLVNTHHGTCIVKFSTVIGGREYRHQLPVSKELITILHHLHFFFFHVMS